VFAGPKCIEFAGPERVAWLVKAHNAVPVIQRKTRNVVEVQLLDYGDCTRLPAHTANDQTYTYRFEDDSNPRGVWSLKPMNLVEKEQS